jgi:hypothetical protein
MMALIVGATLLVPTAPSVALDDDDDDDDEEEELTPCEETARALRTASRHEALDDFYVGVANCLNVTRRRDALACFRENAQALDEALELLAEQFEARLELCELLGGERYDPAIDPRDFVKGVTNPFFPLAPGSTKVFEKVTDEGVERVEVTVTNETKAILGVECTVVRDVVTLDGERVEDTLDYFAQDRSGAVWYFGELAMNFEDGELVDLGGSWRAGVDGARPGTIMRAAPAAGNVYRQEFLANEAEDAARVSGLGRTVSVPAGVFQGCLETLDFTPLEPGNREAKFYAPGVGVVLEVNLKSGERLELIGVF